ncbi:MAG: Hsp70 family protein, partial [Proteobacteria bacterium]|nr:Hsp70 family protein [Pseudomonadota bacterium]
MGELILGIDLGTTNSLAARVTETGPEIIENSELESQTPSIVTLLPDGDLIGLDAKAQRLIYPESTYYSFKRFMGRGVKDIQEDLSSLPFTVSIGDRDNLLLGNGVKKISPEQMSAMILNRIREKTEKILDCKIKKVVLTVPAYFDDAQRNATRDAAEIAGLEVVRIINEPTAAAIAYGLNEKKSGKIAVYDFGGGTFDISILELKGKLFKVLSTHGNTHLGGDDIDQLVIQKLLPKLNTSISKNDLDGSAIQQYLKKISEELKIGLSNTLETTHNIVIPSLGIDDSITITRSEFDLTIQPIIEETLNHVAHALKAVNLVSQEIDEIVLVGGSSRIPLVRQMVEDFFCRKPHIRLNPDHVVALGAAIQGHLLAGGTRDYL